MQTPAPVSPPVYPDFARRAGALFADLLIALFLQFAAMIAITTLVPVDAMVAMWLLVLPLYFVALPCTRWGTPGKHAKGLKLVTRVGERIGPVRSIVRFAAWLVSLGSLGLAFLPAIWDSRRRALHDFIAGTLVVDASATPEQLAADPTPLPSVERRIAASLVILVLGAFPAWVYYYPMHGREAQEWNDHNLAAATTVVTALDAYKAREGRYPASLAELSPDLLPRMPTLAARSSLYYTAEGSTQCWLAIVYWYTPAFALPTDRVYEYDCATRHWSDLDYGELHASMGPAGIPRR